MAEPEPKEALSPRAHHPPREGLSKASLTIALAGIAATLIAALASSWITGKQQSDLQSKNLAAQSTSTDKVELRSVVDKAESALLQAKAAVLGFEAAHAHASGPTLATPETPAAAARQLAAMRLPEARLTVRLGAKHPITRAYHLAYLGLTAEYKCDRLNGYGDPYVRALVRRAVDEFNARTTGLLGSSVAPKSPVTGSVADLDRIAALLPDTARGKGVTLPACLHG